MPHVDVDGKVRHLHFEVLVVKAVHVVVAVKVILNRKSELEYCGIIQGVHIKYNCQSQPMFKLKLG